MSLANAIMSQIKSIYPLQIPLWDQFWKNTHSAQCITLIRIRATSFCTLQDTVLVSFMNNLVLTVTTT